MPAERRDIGRVFALCFLAMLSEGYDPGVVARARIVPIFGAALFGVLVAALLAGVPGDRFSRKKGVAAALGITCLASFGSAQASTLDHLFRARFVVGCGLGDVAPSVTALLPGSLKFLRCAAETGTS